MELGILVLAVVSQLAIGLFTFFNNLKSATHRFFLLLTIASSGWSVVNYLSLHQSTPEATLDAIRWVMFLGLLWALSIFLTIHTFPSRRVTLNKYIIISVFCVVAVVLGLTQTSLVFSSIQGSGANASPIPGPGIPLFGATAGLLLISSVYILIQRYRHSRGTLKSQLQYLIFGIMSSAALIFVTNFLLVVVFKVTSLIFLGPLFILPSVGFTAYSIIAHQLFDIRIIIRRTVIYSGLLLFTLGLYSMVVFIFSAAFGGNNAFQPTTFIANLIAALFIALGFDPIRHYLTRATDKYLFKVQYDAQAVLNDLSEQLSESIDIQSAAQIMVTLIRTNMRLKHAAVVTFSAEESKIVVKDVIHDSYPDPSLLNLRPENLLLQQMARHPQILNTEELQAQCENLELSHQDAQACQMLLVDLEKLGVAVAIPILLKEKAIGIFVVSEKLSGDLFSTDDIEFLRIVANQTTNAIQKARFWEEDQLKSEFVSIASHELLTPTAAIKGYLSMILDDNMGQVDEQARGFLVKVAGSADRLAHLVEDLLNVSRIEGGRLKINKQNFSLVEQAQKAVDELQVNAKGKGLDLAFVADQNPLPFVFADPDQFYRVLINLIGNAIKYTPQGWVRCFVTQSDETHLMFTVTDSGLGIPAENQSHLFEKFYRADRREIYGIQGTGLGLYISKKVIEIMGGQITLTSEVNKGTTFYVTVPIASAAAAPAPVAPPAPNADNLV